MNQQPTLAIVTPCYNEEETVTICYDRVRRLFEPKEAPLARYQRCHLFIDNHSTDTTLTRLAKLANDDPHVRVIALSRNFGPFHSLYHGLTQAPGDIVCPFLPADLQDPPELLIDFVAQWEAGYPVVCGIRRNRPDTLLKRCLRTTFLKLIARLSPFDLPYDQGEYSLLDRQAVELLKTFNEPFPWLRGMIAYLGLPTAHIPYTWEPRRAGRSKSTPQSLVMHGLDAFLTFTTAPTRLALILGFIIAALSFTTAALTCIVNLIYYRQLAPPGIPLLIVALFFFSGLQLFLTGLVGEHVLRIAATVNRRPAVVETQRFGFPSDENDQP